MNNTNNNIDRTKYKAYLSLLYLHNNHKSALHVVQAFPKQTTYNNERVMGG